MDNTATIVVVVLLVLVVAFVVMKSSATPSFGGSKPSGTPNATTPPAPTTDPMAGGVAS